VRRHVLRLASSADQRQRQHKRQHDSAKSAISKGFIAIVALRCASAQNSVVNVKK
jgi:hypothetical protein